MNRPADPLRDGLLLGYLLHKGTLTPAEAAQRDELVRRREAREAERLALKDAAK